MPRKQGYSAPVTEINSPRKAITDLKPSARTFARQNQNVEVVVEGDLSALSTEPSDFKGKTNVRRKFNKAMPKGKKAKPFPRFSR